MSLVLTVIFAGIARITGVRIIGLGRCDRDLGGNSDWLGAGGSYRAGLYEEE